MSDVAQLLLAHGLLTFMFTGQTVRDGGDGKVGLACLSAACAGIWLISFINDIGRLVQ